MSEKKIFTLPPIRCNEALYARTHRASEAKGLTVTAFVYEAIVEKLEKMHSEWSALNSIFGTVEKEGKGDAANPCNAAEYKMYDEGSL